MLSCMFGLLQNPGEWKVFLESVMLEVRACNWKHATDRAVEALQLHTGTGRLWAILVQLRQVTPSLTSASCLTFNPA